MSVTITITGTGYTEDSVARCDGVDIVTTYNGSTELEAIIPDAVMEVAGAKNITVFNPTPGGGESAAEVFTVGYADPTLSSIDPDEVDEESGAVTVTITGTGFAPVSQAKFDGSNRTTNYNSPTEIEIELLSTDADDAGSFDITVFNPTPAGGTSNALPFVVSSATPILITETGDNIISEIGDTLIVEN